MFGAGCQHEACGEQDLSAVWTSGCRLYSMANTPCNQCRDFSSVRISFLALESGSLVLGACMQPASRQQGAEFIG